MGLVVRLWSGCGWFRCFVFWLLAAFALVVLIVDLGRLGLMVSYGHLLVVGVFYACDNLFGLCL